MMVCWICQTGVAVTCCIHLLNHKYAYVLPSLMFCSMNVQLNLLLCEYTYKESKNSTEFYFLHIDSHLTLNTLLWCKKCSTAPRHRLVYVMGLVRNTFTLQPNSFPLAQLMLIHKYHQEFWHSVKGTKITTL